MTIEKPNMNKVWADDADQNFVVDPDVAAPGKIERGWLPGEVPPAETFNYEQNRQGQFAKHVNIEGMPVWDKDTPYVKDSYAKDPDDGLIYKSVVGTTTAPNVDKQPKDSPGYWSVVIGIEFVVTPTNISPIDNAETGQTPTLVTSAYRSLLNTSHTDTEYRIATDASFENVIYFRNGLGAVTSHLVDTPLPAGSDFWWDVRYQDEDGNWSGRSTATSFSAPNNFVVAPTNLLPADNDLTVTDTQTFTCDTFESTPPSTHFSSQWQISKDATFATVDLDSGEDQSNLLSYDVTGLELNETVYYWRVRHRSTSLGWSSYSTPTTFTTVNESVQKPTNVYPANGQTEISNYVLLKADQFTPVPAGTQSHTASQWQVSTDANFGTTVVDTGEDILNLESYQVTGLVNTSTTHYWRVRYKGDVTGWSQWSTPTTFVTKAEFTNWATWDGTQDGGSYDIESSAYTSLSFRVMGTTKLGSPTKTAVALKNDVGYNDVYIVSYAGTTPSVGNDWHSTVGTVGQSLVGVSDSRLLCIFGDQSNTYVRDLTVTNLDISNAYGDGHQDTFNQPSYCVGRCGGVMANSSRAVAMLGGSSDGGVALVLIDVATNPCTILEVLYLSTQETFSRSIEVLDTDKIAVSWTADNGTGGATCNTTIVEVSGSAFAPLNNVVTFTVADADVPHNIDIGVTTQGNDTVIVGTGSITDSRSVEANVYVYTESGGNLTYTKHVSQAVAVLGGTADVVTAGISNVDSDLCWMYITGIGASGGTFPNDDGMGFTIDFSPATPVIGTLYPIDFAAGYVRDSCIVPLTETTLAIVSGDNGSSDMAVDTKVINGV
jgi:hypothetical protein